MNLSLFDPRGGAADDRMGLLKPGAGGRFPTGSLRAGAGAMHGDVD